MYNSGARCARAVQLIDTCFSSTPKTMVSVCSQLTALWEPPFEIEGAHFLTFARYLICRYGVAEGTRPHQAFELLSACCEKSPRMAFAAAQHLPKIGNVLVDHCARVLRSLPAPL